MSNHIIVGCRALEKAPQILAGMTNIITNLNGRPVPNIPGHVVVGAGHFFDVFGAVAQTCNLVFSGNVGAISNLAAEMESRAWETFQDSIGRGLETTKELALGAGCAAAGDYEGALEHGKNALENHLNEFPSLFKEKIDKTLPHDRLGEQIHHERAMRQWENDNRIAESIRLQDLHYGENGWEPQDRR